MEKSARRCEDKRIRHITPSTLGVRDLIYRRQKSGITEQTSYMTVLSPYQHDRAPKLEPFHILPTTKSVTPQELAGFRVRRLREPAVWLPTIGYPVRSQAVRLQFAVEVNLNRSHIRRSYRRKIEEPPPPTS